MTFNIVNRRTHLYLGLALIPWVLMYGVSSFIINHGAYFNKLFDDGTPRWTQVFEQEYHRPVPEDADLREVATEILNEFDLRPSFFVNRRNPDRLNIHVRDLLSIKRLVYFIDEGRLVMEQHRFQWNSFLVGLHVRGGYQQDLFLDDLWAVVLDLVCIAFVLWIATGIYLWWSLPQTRLWGWAALLGGILSFGWFLWAL